MFFFDSLFRGYFCLGGDILLNSGGNYFLFSRELISYLVGNYCFLGGDCFYLGGKTFFIQGGNYFLFRGGKCFFSWGELFLV